MALRTPGAVGANVTVIVQAPPLAAMVPPQLVTVEPPTEVEYVKSAGFVPERAIPVTDNAAPPLLVTVADSGAPYPCAGGGATTTTLGKLRVFVLALNPATGVEVTLLPPPPPQEADQRAKKTQVAASVRAIPRSLCSGLVPIPGNSSAAVYPSQIGKRAYKQGGSPLKSRSGIILQRRL